jgi:spermidine/putrescine transport system ATP-binding protein
MSARLRSYPAASNSALRWPARCCLSHACLLLDEPLAALDLKLRKQMQLELKGLQRRLGISFIYVTHDQEEALTMSDRIVVMNAGHVEQIGRAEEIYERPVSEFVAGFIGMSNIIEATVAEVRDGLSIVNINDSSVAVQGDVVAAGDRVRLMVRPEKIKLSKDGADGRARRAHRVGGLSRRKHAMAHGVRRRASHHRA